MPDQLISIRKKRQMCPELRMRCIGNLYLLKKCTFSKYRTLKKCAKLQNEILKKRRHPYENLVAQIISSTGRELYYHTWEKKGSTHYYEIDFLISKGNKVSVVEVKSSGTGKHESIDEFAKKFRTHIESVYLLSQKDAEEDGMVHKKPLYLTPFIVD